MIEVHYAFHSNKKPIQIIPAQGGNRIELVEKWEMATYIKLKDEAKNICQAMNRSLPNLNIEVVKVIIRKRFTPEFDVIDHIEEDLLDIPAVSDNVTT